MKKGMLTMGLGLFATGFNLMPFWFTVVCVGAGLAFIEQEREGWE